MRTLKGKRQQADRGMELELEIPPPNSSQFLHFLFFDISYPGSMAVQNPEQSAGYGKKQLQEMPSAIYLKTNKKDIQPLWGNSLFPFVLFFLSLQSQSPNSALATEDAAAVKQQILKTLGERNSYSGQRNWSLGYPHSFFFLFLSSCC